MTLPDVFLISIDCLRPDHVGAFNRLSRLTPNLDRILSRGTLFTRAVSHAPFTTPAVASLLAGRYPFETGVRLLLGQLCNPDAGTMAEAARRAGYVTAGFPSSFILNSETGLNRGFDEYRDIEDGVMTHRGGCWQDSAPLNRSLDAFLRRAGRDRVFCWLHYFDLHEYHQDTSLPPQTSYARDLNEKIDGGSIAELMAILDRHQRLNDAAFVITADHGECLFQHGVRGHGQHLYNSVLHVPLGIAWPSRFCAGDVRNLLVRHVDLLPTLMDLWDVEPDGKFDRLPGRSLVSTSATPNDLASYAEASPRQLFDGKADDIRAFEGPEIQAIQTQDYKLIRHTSGERELYDLRIDPGEFANRMKLNEQLWQDQADVLARHLDEIVTARGASFASTSAASPRCNVVHERLRDLGYV